MLQGCRIAGRTHCHWSNLFDSKHSPVVDISGEIARAESSGADHPAFHPMDPLQVGGGVSVSLGRGGEGRGGKGRGGEGRGGEGREEERKGRGRGGEGRGGEGRGGKGRGKGGERGESGRMRATS